MLDTLIRAIILKKKYRPCCCGGEQGKKLGMVYLSIPRYKSDLGTLKLTIPSTRSSRTVQVCPQESQLEGVPLEACLD